MAVELPDDIAPAQQLASLPVEEAIAILTRAAVL
jgi:hypothetical protein